jgi:hydroxymethylpyrimidine/phosphomethylpyrimidine kinase
MMIPNCVALTIAGSDSGGGAGIQADLKTFSALGVYGSSVITAITAQNLDGVTAIQAINPDIVKAQLLAVLTGFPVKGIKTGMLFSSDIIEVVAKTYGPYRNIPLVIDPVFAATSGSKLIQDSAISSLEEKLFPLAALITPNIPEAEFLTGDKLINLDDLKSAAEKLFRHYHIPILAKGGHLTDGAHDVLFDNEGLKVYPGNLIAHVNNHGSGCVFSAGIAAELAKGIPLRDAIASAKDYLYNALKYNHLLKDNTRVIDHFWMWK